MDKKHTALPWLVVPETLGSIESEGGIQVAQTMQTKPVKCADDHEERLANAAYIVRACNVHYELLEAAKFALRIAESWIHDQLDGTDSLTGALLGLEPVRDVIRKAEAE